MPVAERERSLSLEPGASHGSPLARVKASIPAAQRRWVRKHLLTWPPVGWVRFGSLRRLTPISSQYGYDRGLPTDRHYIEGFLHEHRDAVRGRVLEVKDNAYTARFGGDRVTRSDVLDLTATEGTTLVGDLATGEGIPQEAFDCIILTQVLQYIYDVPAAIRTSWRALRPGGELLVTVPGIIKVDRDTEQRLSDYWRFTECSARRLFAEAFAPDDVTVQGYGNVLTAMAFLTGISAGELKRHELDHHDPDYDLLIAVRAVKAGGAR